MLDNDARHFPRLTTLLAACASAPRDGASAQRPLALAAASAPPAATAPPGQARNAILGRSSTAAERADLEHGGYQG